MVAASLAALFVAGPPALAQERPAGLAPLVDDPGRGGGWRGLPPTDPDIDSPTARGRAQSDAEAAGLRLSVTPSPGGSRTVAAEQERARAQQRRAPWIDRSRPATPGTSGLNAPQPGRQTLSPSNRPAPTANPRTGKPPRVAGRAADPNAPQLGLRPLTPPTSRARTPQPIRISDADRRALAQGRRGVTPPVVQPRSVETPIVTNATVRGSGRVLPNANPLGRNAVIDPATGEILSFARTPQPEPDAFAATGLRVGSFNVLPAAELAIGFDSNPARTPAGRGSTLIQTTGEVQATSDWARHQVTARLRGTYSAYASQPALNRPEIQALTTGRFDVTRDLRIESEGRYNLAAQSPGSATFPTGAGTLRGLPLVHQLGASLGATQDVNRLQVTLRGSLDRYSYQDAQTTTGVPVPQGFRNYTAVGGRLRVGYELTPGVRPFVEASVERRLFDQPAVSGGPSQGSTAYTLRAGSSFELTRLITGEISAGQIVRNANDPAVATLRGAIVDGSLVWTVTPLTTVRLAARSSVDESTTAGSNGLLRREFSGEVEHNFRRWLTGTARIAYSFEDLSGTTRRDRRLAASAIVTYRASPTLQVRGELRHERLQSNVPGVDYTANIALIGLRLQR